LIIKFASKPVTDFSHKNMLNLLQWKPKK